MFSGTQLTCIRGERLVFEDLGFSVEEGAALYLTGANGSGKSSLLRVMAALQRPAAGELCWNEADVWDDIPAHHDRTRYVGHADGVKPVLSIGENLAFWAAISATRPEPAGHGVQTALSRVGLGELSDMPARFLSAGQRRRLNLARLLASPARLWLLDEPAAGLDEESAAVLESMIASHLARGGMAVVATHDAVPAGARRLELP
ncbi:MAG: heme ABC exporter ATP-binding protein CcmA [Rhodospirillales bacterium]|nr:heme ABC exporter ATP-binding protein CcmA [Rhodospirillales bacterium]